MIQESLTELEIPVHVILGLYDVVKQVLELKVPPTLLKLHKLLPQLDSVVICGIHLLLGGIYLTLRHIGCHLVLISLLVYDTSWVPGVEFPKGVLDTIVGAGSVSPGTSSRLLWSLLVPLV